MEFDKLLVKYKNRKSDDVAEILLWKGKLFQEVLKDEETAQKTFLQLKKEYPSSDFAAEADAFLISLKLRVGVEFPPCVDEMSNIVKAYKKYHDRGFEIIGISLDQNKNKFLKFIEDNGMTWRQYYDGKGGQNKLARRYSIDSIPSTFLIDANGKIIAKNLRGSALEEAIKEAVTKL